MSTSRILTGVLAFATAALALSDVRADDRVLLVGINDYQHDTIGVPDLGGCVNDSTALKAMLKSQYGFKESQIKMLLDTQATRAKVLAAIRTWLVAGSKSGDRVVFAFSGHGTQAKDTDNEEADGRDEMLCCRDYHPQTQAGGIRDDELRVLLNQLNGRKVTVLIDSCHSGTVTRSIPRLNYRAKADTVPVNTYQVRWVPPPPEVQGLPMPRAGARDAGAIDTPGMNHVLYAACQDSQTAADASFFENGKRIRQGAFTYFAVKGLAGAADTNGDKKITNKELIGYVQNRMRSSSHNFSQIPEMRTRDIYFSEPVFWPAGGGGGNVVTEAQVVQLQGAMAIINRGSNHGVTNGSNFEILQRLGGQERVVGRLVVSQVAAMQASGQTVNLAVQQLPLFVRQSSFNPGGGVGPTGLLRVYMGKFAGAGGWVNPPAELIQVIQTEPRFGFIAQMGQADRVVQGRHIGGQIEVAVANRFGVVERRYVGASAAEAARFLREGLGRAYVLTRLGQLQNPNPSFRVTLGLASGFQDFGFGEEIQFNVSSSQAAFLTMMDIDSEGNLTRLFPNQWHPGNAVQGGQVYRFPPANAGFRFFARAPAGTDVVFAIATQQQLPLVQGTGTIPVAQAMNVADGIIRQLRGLGRGITVGLPTRGWSAASVTVQTIGVQP